MANREPLWINSGTTTQLDGATDGLSAIALDPGSAQALTLGGTNATAVEFGTGIDSVTGTLTIGGTNASSIEFGAGIDADAAEAFVIGGTNATAVQFGANIDKQINDFSGDYDIIGFANELPPYYIDQVLADPEGNVTADMFTDIVAPVGGSVCFNATNFVTGEESKVTKRLAGFDDDFLRSGRFTLTEWLDEYDDEEDVWDAVRTDPGLVLFPRGFQALRRFAVSRPAHRSPSETRHIHRPYTSR